jgi:hypothetical protein
MIKAGSREGRSADKASERATRNEEETAELNKEGGELEVNFTGRDA